MERAPAINSVEACESEEMHDWNDHYASNPRPSTRPDPGFVETARGLPPGRALDLGCGEGAEALWLASRGWSVTAVDYAPAALATLRRLASENGLEVRTIEADLLDPDFDPRTVVDAGAPANANAYDLVYIGYLHMEPKPRAAVLRAAERALAAGGTILYIGITRAAGPASKPSPNERLATADEIAADLASADVESAEVRRRLVGCPEDAFEADVLIARARLPSRAASASPQGTARMAPGRVGS